MSDHSSAPARPSFRPDIQGMRALAVLTVIGAHAGVGALVGGFIGVDVFFVISGFLITSLLVRESSRAGRVSLVGFYARRARRLLPASSLVLLVTVTAALVFLPLVRAVEIIRDSVWSVLFAANVRFASVGTDYFAKGEPPSPLQHYWSLSVEEQFYLVWPLFIVTWLAWSRWRKRPARLRTLAIVLGLVTAGSLAYSVVATYTSPTAAYFSTPARAYELGAGCLTALLLAHHRRPLPARLSGALGVVGLGAIAVSTLTFDATTPMPGYAALVPTIGTVFLLLAGAGAREAAPLVTRLLSIGPARVVGDWSYSLYLWHWPVLRIAEDRLGRDLPVAHTAALLVLIFALSAATYRWVETPFRSGVRWSRPSLGIVLYPVSVAMVLAMAFGGRTWVDRELGISGDNAAITTADYSGEDLSSDRYVALVQASVLAAQDGRPVPSDLEPPLLGLQQDTASLGDCDYRRGTRDLCPLGDEDSDRAILLLGDSHARAWSPAIDRLGDLTGHAVYNLVYSGCSVTGAVQVDLDTKRPWDDCEEFKDWTREAIAEVAPDLVVVATSAVSPMMADQESEVVGMTTRLDDFREIARDGFDQAVVELADLTPRLVLLGNTPNLPREPGVCLSSRGVDLGDCLFERGPVAREIQLDFQQIATSRGVEVVDATQWFCYDGLCPSVVGSTITMRDREHMTTAYSQQLAVPLAEQLKLALP